VIKDLIKYLQKKASAALSSLPNLLASSDTQVGLILTERLINMPSEIVPPMYTMLLEEIEWALEEKEPYNFSHYLILSKTYAEVESKVDQEDARPSKKKKSTASLDEAFYFHPEDEVLQKYAAGYCSFDYTKQNDEGASDSKRAFSELGISPKGHLILIAAGKFKDAVGAVSDFLKPPT
jgi:protein BCP1